MNDCDNCKHRHVEPGKNCDVCQGAGDGEYPGWEPETTNNVPVTKFEPIPEYLHRVAEEVNPVVEGNADSASISVLPLEYSERETSAPPNSVRCTITFSVCLDTSMRSNVQKFMCENRPVTIVFGGDAKKLGKP